MTAKEYLLQYKEAYREAQEIELQITQLRLKYALTAPIQLSDMPKAHNTEHGLSDYAAKLDDLTRCLADKYSRCMTIEKDILKRIDRMEDNVERQVLRYRYTNITEKGRLMSWEGVAEMVGYTRRMVTNIHGRALCHFPLD